MANSASLVKSAVGIFYVYLMFLACNLPYFACLTAFKIYGPKISLKRLLLFLSTAFICLIIFEPCNLLLEDEAHSTRY